MNENDENVVETTENAGEQTAEELVEGAKVTTEEATKVEPEEKTYTEADFEKTVNERVNKLLNSRIERAKSKMERETAEKLSKYERMESILKAGLQTNNTDETISKLADFYSKQGVEIPTERASYSERDTKALAEIDAREIIDAGYDELVSEVDRLAQIPLDKMSTREKLTFQKLAEERKRQDGIRELRQEGISETILDNQDYKDFTKKLNPSLSEKEKYQLYLSIQPKKPVEPIGSMKGTTKVDKYKDYYTPEEGKRLTEEDLDDPRIMKALEYSMQEWQRKKIGR